MDKPLASTIATTPGIYIYKDAKNKIIYVGKARNLRKRVLSYFQADEKLSPKTRAMIANAATIETISTITEKEALLLEASLIKKYRPRYNITLRDDKQYVLFRIDKHKPYPRLEIVRQSYRDNAKYFGPFTSAAAAKQTWKMLHRAFNLRRCSDKAMKNRVRPCLYYYIKQCLAPCTENVDKEIYADLIHNVELFLSSRSTELLDMLKNEMLVASEELYFEKAAALRDQIIAIERTIEMQSVVLPTKSDIDVIGIVPVQAEHKQGIALGVLFIREGRLIDRRNFFWREFDLDDAFELLSSFIGQFYSEQNIPPARITIPWYEEELEQDYCALENLLSSFRGAQVHIGLARNQAEHRLINMAEENAKEAAKQSDKTDPNYLASKLAEHFKVDTPINRIECVDVSHISGQATRVGMVVFEHAKALHNAYRTYSIQAGGDDVLALSTWAEQRLKDETALPDLLLIDGGRGQINAVQKIMPNQLIAGIVKARNEQGYADRRAGNVADIILLPNRINPLNFHAGSQELLFLQLIRDHAHNYALNKHRKARGKEALTGDLLRLPGVGTKTAELLWSRFKSLEEMIEADEKTLASIEGIGQKRSKVLAQRLKSLKN